MQLNRSVLWLEFLLRLDGLRAQGSDHRDGKHVNFKLGLGVSSNL